MKFMDYTSVSKITNDNYMLIDGNNGTRKIAVTTAAISALAALGWQNRRMIFRGKNLGSEVTVAQKAAIQNGSFDDLCLGDYWEINGVKYRIADFDYWYGKGNPAFTSHHLVIVPDTTLGTSKMNASSDTTGGYVSSYMYTTALSTVKNTIETAFGTAVLSHKDYFITTVASGYPSEGSYLDSDVDLMNEIMVYGSYIYTPNGNGTIDVKRYTINNTQLALFRVDPTFILSGNGYWLRDVASATHFARVDSYGGATSTGAANEYGIRPVFAIG